MSYASSAANPATLYRQVLSIDQEPELLEKEIAIMGDTVNEYLVGFIGYFVIKRQVAVSDSLASNTIVAGSPPRAPLINTASRSDCHGILRRWDCERANGAAGEKRG